MQHLIHHRVQNSLSKVRTTNYNPPFHFVVLFKFTLILPCLRLYMHSPADTGTHSLAAVVQNFMTTPTFILMPKTEGKLQFLCLLSLHGIVLY